MKGLQMMLKALGLDLDANTLAMIQALIPQLPAKINEASAAINAALQNFDKRLQAIEKQLADLKDGPRLQAIEKGLVELLKDSASSAEFFGILSRDFRDLRGEVLNGHTGRASDTPGPTDAGASGGDSGSGTAGTGRRRRGE